MSPETETETTETTETGTRSPLRSFPGALSLVILGVGYTLLGQTLLDAGIERLSDACGR